MFRFLRLIINTIILKNKENVKVEKALFNILTLQKRSTIGFDSLMNFEKEI